VGIGKFEFYYGCLHWDCLIHIVSGIPMVREHRAAYHKEVREQEGKHQRLTFHAATP
jgi:hypothetical protein